MFGWLSKRKEQTSATPVAKPSTGSRRVYAIGDIHGRLDLLQQLHDLIAADVAAAPPPVPPLLVYLGDYVDRGADSRGVVDLLLAPPPIVAERVCLAGNHERTLQAFLADSTIGPDWFSFGGLETVLSYGTPVERKPSSAAAFEATREAFAAVFPAAHFAFLADLPMTHTVGDYVFVHAGLRPGRALAQQTEQDMLWIRDEFLDSSADFGRIVVHGHSPVEQVDVRRNRINVDTGAYSSNRLSCLVLEGDSRAMLQTG